MNRTQVRLTYISSGYVRPRYLHMAQLLRSSLTGLFLDSVTSSIAAIDYFRLVQVVIDVTLHHLTIFTP